MSTQYDQYKEQVKGPGKFEGEQPYVPYYYEIWNQGFYDHESDDGKTATFKVTKEDRDIFPELKGRHWVKIQETEQGFVQEITGQ